MWEREREHEVANVKQHILSEIETISIWVFLFIYLFIILRILRLNEWIYHIWRCYVLESVKFTSRVLYCICSLPHITVCVFSDAHFCTLRFPQRLNQTQKKVFKKKQMIFCDLLDNSFFLSFFIYITDSLFSLSRFLTFRVKLEEGFRISSIGNTMAKFLNQTGLISSWHDDVQQYHRKISLFPKTRCHTSGVSWPVRRFPSLKMNSQLLRSSSFASSEFNGKKLVFHEHKRVRNRRNSPFRSSIAAQVGNSLMISFIPCLASFFFLDGFSFGVLNPSGINKGFPPSGSHP